MTCGTHECSGREAAGPARDGWSPVLPGHAMTKRNRRTYFLAHVFFILSAVAYDVAACAAVRAAVS